MEYVLPAFQAAKCPERMQEFCGLSPQKAKRLGRSVELRPDWERVPATAALMLSANLINQSSQRVIPEAAQLIR